METIQVLDALPGTGKSTAIFNMMRKNQDSKYIYVSPLLSEVEVRIQSELPEMQFKAPKSDSDTKTADVLKLLLDGENIATTHSLFSLMDQRHWQVIQSQGYTLILDEEINVVEEFACKSRDVTMMVEQDSAEITYPYNQVILKKPVSYFVGGSFENIAKEASKGNLYTTKTNTFLVTQIPIELFKAAEQTIIVTYMFEGCVLERFLRLHGIEWKYLDIPLYRSNDDVIKTLRDNIKFVHIPTMDPVKRISLSSTWYKRTATPTQLQLIGKIVRGVRTHADNDDNRIMAALPKLNASKGPKYVGRPKDRPVSNVYLSAMSRATNDHSHKDVVLHCYDRYPHVSVSAYFQSHGLPIDSDQFALSEMIQFVFRSAVRNGKPISLFVASTRMKKLLEDWLNSQEEEQQLLENYA